MSLPEYSIVIPVYNEGPNIEAMLRSLDAAVQGDYEILVVYDFDEDNTLPVIRGMNPQVPRLRLVKNRIGKGAVNALKTGFQASRGWLGVVVTMADLSDPPERIGDLVRKLREGYDVVAGSRYMRGGKQIGGPFLKGLMSRAAGLLAYWLTGVGIHDVTTNFRAYSRRLLSSVTVESQGGFELGLELTVKAHLSGWRVGETPSTWRDRSAGQSRFKLLKWLPGYLSWYSKLYLHDLFGLSPWIRARRRARPQAADYTFFGVYDRPGYGWTVCRFAPAVVIIAVDRDGRFVLVQIQRPFQEEGAIRLEFPGGGADNDESVADCSLRELREETGYGSDSPPVVFRHSLEPVPGMGQAPHWIVLLNDCYPIGDAPAAKGEGISGIKLLTAAEIHAHIQDGQITAMPTITAFGMFEAGLFE